MFDGWLKISKCLCSSGGKQIPEPLLITQVISACPSREQRQLLRGFSSRCEARAAVDSRRCEVTGNKGDGMRYHNVNTEQDRPSRVAFCACLLRTFDLLVKFMLSLYFLYTFQKKERGDPKGPWVQVRGGPNLGAQTPLERGKRTRFCGHGVQALLDPGSPGSLWDPWIHKQERIAPSENGKPLLHQGLSKHGGGRRRCLRPEQ